MKASALSTVLCLAAISTAVFAEDAAPKKEATKEEIKARLAEHARKKALGPAAEAAAAKAAAAERDKSAVENKPAAPAIPVPTAATAVTPEPAAAATTAPEPAKVLPKFQVQNSRITELDRQVAKQNQEIAREKKNTQPTKLDETLNGPKISKALAIFGGQSSDDRANVAKERVAMMEDERGLIEAIAQAQTKEEKAELEKTLVEARATRRELEASLR